MSPPGEDAVDLFDGDDALVAWFLRPKGSFYEARHDAASVRTWRGEGFNDSAGVELELVAWVDSV